MSVLARFRKESPFEARDLAREIEVKIIRLCMNEKYYPKRYRYTISQSLIDSALRMSDYITAANALPNNEQHREQREKYQQNAYMMCEVILRKLDLSERLEFSIPEGLLTEIIEMILKEEKAITGWINASKKKKT